MLPYGFNLLIFDNEICWIFIGYLYFFCDFRCFKYYYSYFNGSVSSNLFPGVLQISHLDEELF